MMLLKGGGSGTKADPQTKASQGSTPKNTAGSTAPKSHAPASSTPSTGGAKSPKATAPASVAPGNSGGGQTFPYRVISQDQGYFEETVTVVNRTGRPWTTWQLSFTVPGANVRDIWGGVLAQRGTDPIVRNAPAQAVVQPGDSFEITFGASGDTVMAPQNCTFNGSPCTFTQ